MRNKITIYISLLILIIAAILVLRPDRLLFPSFQDQIDKIDKYYRDQPTGIPEKNYLRALKKAKTKLDYLQLIKRCLVENRDKVVLNSLLLASTEAAQSLDEEELWAYHIMALLLNNDIPRAMSYISKLSSKEFQPLLLELYAKFISQVFADLDTESTAIPILEAYGSKIYLDASLLFKNPRYRYNAALLYLHSGEFNLAYKAVRPLVDYPWVNHELLGLIFYQNNLYTDALIQFLLKYDIDKEAGSDDFTSIRSIADIYFIQGDYRQSIRYYNEILEASSPTWQDYYNLAESYRSISDDLNAFRVLRQGLLRFPQNNYILTKLILSIPKEQYRLAVSTLEDFRTEGIQVPATELLNLLMNVDALEADQFLSALWQLYNRYPERISILKYLVWYALGIDHIDDIKIALNRFANISTNISDPWLEEYNGIVYSLEGDYTQAISHLKNSVDIEKNWHNIYNLALQYFFIKDYKLFYNTLEQGFPLLETAEQRFKYAVKLLEIKNESGMNYAIPADLLQDLSSNDLDLGIYKELENLYDQTKK